MVMFAQASDIFGTIIWFLLFFVMIFLYPRLMLSQLLYKIEQSAVKMEKMSDDSNRIVAKKIGRTDKETKQKIEAFTDFFVVEPSSIDPYGLVRKIDQTIRSMEHRFTEFADEIAPGRSYADRQQINYGLRAAMGCRQLAKIVRHNVELAKKFKNLQIAMILQMQLPIIEKIAESELKGTEAFVNNWPVGDSIGPLVAASMMEKGKEIAKDVSMGETRIEGRKCFVLKAKGNGPHLGRVDEAITNIMKRHRIARIITIDAALKMEGEKTGSVAEGTGFAMGGWGQREMIESMLMSKKMPIDSIVVKVGMTEAIVPMRKAVYDSMPKVHEYMKRAVLRTRKNDKLIIIGVGNSSGISDDKTAVEHVGKLVHQFETKVQKEQKQKKGGWI
ncbi:MAG: DUF1512 family protein [Candidatus Aenigmarchaeota archaeon]|nr:DUF1512 family protein [Candidatus Aenigmarchaeota archaeon]